MKKVMSILVILSLITSLCTITVLAHSTKLNIEYDDCSKEENVAGDNELWYKVDEIFYNRPNGVFHLSHEVFEIKYYFSPTSQYQTSNTWIDNVKTVWQEKGIVLSNTQAATIVEQIQEIFSNSMKKWNNIYYYVYDEAENMYAKRIITVSEGTMNDHNVIIYPKTEGSIASIMDCDVLYQEFVEEYHFHCPLYYMYIGLSQCFDMINTPDAAKSIAFCENSGAHEMGHILGLTDLDAWDCTCQCDNCMDGDINNDCLGHHEEALMGYGEHANRVTHITYRDISGVAITRGFHTDDDHMWMLRTNADNTQDVICALCNGVRYGITLTNGKYEDQTPKVYQSCIHHGGTNEQMLLVATNGIHNYYKCLYCRHIAEIDIEARGTIHQYNDYNIWENMSSLNEDYYTINLPYTKSYNFSFNKDSGWVVQLFDSNFSLVEEINNIFSSNGADVLLDSGTYYVRIKNLGTDDENFRLVISPNHTHDYSEWTYYSSTQHVSCCSLCGETGTTYGAHATKQSLVVGNKATCFICGFAFSLDNGFGQIIHNVQKVSVNGSYILPNGIIVLVDEDVEAYMNGTLVFYDKDKVPELQ